MQVVVLLTTDPTVDGQLLSEVQYIHEVQRHLQVPFKFITTRTSKHQLASMQRHLGAEVTSVTRVQDLPPADIVFTWANANDANYIGGDIPPRKLNAFLFLSHYSRTSRIFSRLNDHRLKYIDPLTYARHKQNINKKFAADNARTIDIMEQAGPIDYSRFTYIMNGSPDLDWRYLTNCQGTSAFIGDSILFGLNRDHKRCRQVHSTPMFLGILNSWNSPRVKKLQVLQPETSLSIYSDKPCDGLSVTVGNYIAGTKPFYDLFGSHRAAINIGKGTNFYAYRPKTIYDANIGGAPVLIDLTEDSNRQAFPDIACYYESTAQLKAMLATLTPRHRADLLAQQDEVLLVSAKNDAALFETFIRGIQ